MNYSDSDLEGLSFSELMHLREQAKTQADQNRYGNAEHQAYTRGVVEENPLAAIPLAAMIPAYDIKKRFTGEGRSEPGLAQMGAGYAGIMQGLRNGLLARMYPQGNN